MSERLGIGTGTGTGNGNRTGAKNRNGKGVFRRIGAGWQAFRSESPNQPITQWPNRPILRGPRRHSRTRQDELLHAQVSNWGWMGGWVPIRYTRARPGMSCLVAFCSWIQVWLSPGFRVECKRYHGNRQHSMSVDVRCAEYRVRMPCLYIPNLPTLGTIRRPSK